jgi:hypothetical protein
LSYAVVWSDDGAPARAGRLVVTESGLELHRRGDDGQPALMVIDAGALATARATNGNGERVNGCPTIVLELRDGTIVRIGALEFAIVRELLDRVAALPAEAVATARALVVVPLRKGSAAKACELVAQGPPFDPGAVGLTRHEVFVSDDRALFLLEAPHIDETVERMLHDVSLWRGAVAWRSCLAGRPTLASVAYSWTSNGQTQ